MKLIGITGYKQSGKDTVLRLIREQLPKSSVVRLNFADSLKEEVAEACKVDLTFIDKHKDIFRPVLQWWGTDFKRQLYGEDYWLLRWGNRLNRMVVQPDLIVATDVRFLNEASMIYNLGGKMVRVLNPRTHSDGHQSETELVSIKCDNVIENNGSISDMIPRIKLILKLYNIT